MTKIGASASGSSRELPVGEELQLHLSENPTTGFRWAVDAADETVIKLDGSGFQRGAPGVGGGGERVFTILGVAPGVTRVRLKRWRAWEGEASVNERFELTVRVVPK